MSSWCTTCDTTLDDIARVRYSKFGHCEDCKAYAIATWQWARKCVGDVTDDIFLWYFSRDGEQVVVADKGE